MIRNNSDPAPPPGQPRAAGYRNSMQELRREPTQYGAEPVPAARQLPARPGQDSPAAVGQAGCVAQGTNAVQLGPVGEMGVPSRAGLTAQTGPAGRGSPTASQRESSREVGLTRGRSITGEDGRVGGDVSGSRRGERPAELLVTRELMEARERTADRRPETGETSVTPAKPPDLDRRLKLSNPVRLVCHETERDPVRDSEV